MDKTGRNGQTAGLEIPAISFPVIKRSVRISGHASSITLEEPFWMELKCCAKKAGLSLNELITVIDAAKSPEINLSSALRVYILQQIKTK